jgi:hypothetical protein
MRGFDLSEWRLAATPKQIRFILFALSVLPPLVARAAPVRPLQTGQKNCYSESGIVIPCANTGQDGEKRAGMVWSSPRFTDNRDGTVSDNLTGLIWLKDANCTESVGGIARPDGLLKWSPALTWSNNLASGKCGLSDNSVAGDWRLPNINELRSLLDYSQHDPIIPSGNPFSNVQSVWYWSSTTNPVYTAGAYTVGLSRGSIHLTPKAGLNLVPGTSRVGPKEGSLLGVWPVRDGK